MQLRFEFGRRHRLRDVISIPSSAISKPLSCTCRRSGELAIRRRLGARMGSGPRTKRMSIKTFKYRKKSITQS